VVEFGVLGCIVAVSVITGVVGTMIMLANASDGTLIFKDLIFPQWWLDWIIPLTALAMTLQAFELMDKLRLSMRPVSHEGAEHLPGIRPEELP
jgi:hypothetical protein